MNRKQRRTELKRSRSATPLATAIAHGTPAAAEGYAKADRLHRLGRTAEAEKLCLAVLAADPDHAHSLHLLGFIAYQSGQNERAIELMTRAAGLNDQEPVFQNNLGNALAQAGQLDAALTHYERALALNPRNAMIHNNLGVLLARLKRHGEAIVQFEQATAINPRYAEAHHNLANAHLELGAVAESITCYQAALALRPDYISAMNNLGNALFQLGRYDESRVHLERALALAPQSAAINNGLGNTLQGLGLWVDATACYERAIALQPDYAEAWTNLAAACNGQKLYEKAIACCDKALSIEPGRSGAYSNRGEALVGLNRLDEAAVSYNRALAINPAQADVYGDIGSILVEQGQIDEAIRFFDQAIALEPRRPKFYLRHVSTKRVAAGDPRLAALEALAGDAASMSDEARIDLHFALAKSYTDTGDHNRAFAELLAGNALKRKSVTYDEAALLSRLEYIAHDSPRSVVDRWRGLGNPSVQPIFILGMPRSGSTLVEQIIASHPAVTAGGELGFFRNAVTAVFGPTMAFLPTPEPTKGSEALLGRIADHYLKALDSLAPGAERVTDKMPGNFAFVGQIHLTLPNARIIHTRRHALDTCLSCFSTLFAGTPYSYDLGEIGRHYRGYDKLMRHWRDVLPEAAMLDVDYEILIADFETQARRIIAYCGLPWDDACLSFHTARGIVKTASAIQVRQPLYSSSVDRWRAIDPGLLRPLRTALGELDHQGP